MNEFGRPERLTAPAAATLSMLSAHALAGALVEFLPSSLLTSEDLRGGQEGCQTTLLLEYRPMRKVATQRARLLADNQGR